MLSLRLQGKTTSQCWCKKFISSEVVVVVTTMLPIGVGALGMVLKGLEKKKSWKLRKNWNCTNHRIVKIGLDIDKSPGNLKRLAVIQTLVKDHQLILVWKTHKDDNNTNLIFWKHYHHHVVPLARISLTFSCHLFLLSITRSRSSSLHPISAQSFCR